MPMWISCTVKKASALQTRMSQAVARSSAPPPARVPVSAGASNVQATQTAATASADSVKASRQSPNGPARTGT